MTTHGHLSFDDLGEVRVDALLIRPDGRELRVPMRTLSDREVWKLRREQKQPVQPTEIRRWDGPDKDPRPGPVTSGAAYEKYQKEVELASYRWLRLLIVKSMLIDIPGATDDEKIDSLEQMGTWAVLPLINHVTLTYGRNGRQVTVRDQGSIRGAGASRFVSRPGR